MQDVYAYGFPRSLDGHPLLAWMGEDWAGFVVESIVAELRLQDPGVKPRYVRVTGEPELETRASGDGTVLGAQLRLPIDTEVRSAAGDDWLLSGLATFTEAFRAFELRSSAWVAPEDVWTPPGSDTLTP